MSYSVRCLWLWLSFSVLYIENDGRDTYREQLVKIYELVLIVSDQIAYSQRRQEWDTSLELIHSGENPFKEFQSGKEERCLRIMLVYTFSLWFNPIIDF